VRGGFVRLAHRARRLLTEQGGADLVEDEPGDVLIAGQLAPREQLLRGLDGIGRGVVFPLPRMGDKVAAREEPARAVVDVDKLPPHGCPGRIDRMLQHRPDGRRLTGTCSS
jgi:hypothetical protein